jgi:hypothetical protein
MGIFLKDDEFSENQNWVILPNMGQLQPIYRKHTKSEKQLALFNSILSTSDAIIKSFKN